MEDKERDYKAEYKKFQSSPKSKKYRAELNKYNRKKGTYGNGDGKDASHKGGKISGFEKESVNRGRREKSRLKKEQKLREVIRKIIDEDFAGAYPAHQRKKFDNTRRKQSEVLGYTLTGQDDVKTEIDDATVKEGKFTEARDITPKGKWIVYNGDDDKTIKVVANRTQAIKLMNKILNAPQPITLNVGAKPLKEGKLTESGIMYKAGVKKYGKEGMTKIQSAAGKDKGHEEIGKIKDKYEKGKKEGVVNEGPKFDEVKANMEKTMGLLVKKMGLKSIGRHLVGKGGMSFFLDDPKEAKKLQKYLLAKIKDVRIINLDKEGGDEANFVVYAKVFDF